MRFCMESAMEKMVPEVPFTVESEVRKTWGDLVNWNNHYLINRTVLD